MAMKKKIKKSRVLWLSRDTYFWTNEDVVLRVEEPELADEEWQGHRLFAFCSDGFRRLFPIGLYKGQKKKVKITIEVIE